jgi:hypothetical protein
MLSYTQECSLESPTRTQPQFFISDVQFANDLFFLNATFYTDSRVTNHFSHWIVHFSRSFDLLYVINSTAGLMTQINEMSRKICYFVWTSRKDPSQ